MRITSTIMPPSTNQSLVWSRGRLIHTSQARTYQTQVKEELEPQLVHLQKEIRSLKGKPLSMTLTITSPLWRTKTGSIRKSDIENRVKLLVDSLFSLLPDLDDSQLYEEKLIKKDGKDILVELSLEELLHAHIP